MQGILPPAHSPHLEEAERAGELIQMARAREEALSDWQFTGLDLCGESLRELRFERCVFTGCRLAGCDLQGVSFVDVVFKNCDLSGVQGREVYFCRCAADGLKALGAVFTDCRMAHVTVQNSSLSCSNFTGASLEKVRFDHTDFTEASLSECRHKQWSFGDCTFIKTSFFKTPLKGMDFTTSRLEGAVVSTEATELRGAVVNIEQAADLARLLGLVIR